MTFGRENATRSESAVEKETKVFFERTFECGLRDGGELGRLGEESFGGLGGVGPGKRDEAADGEDRVVVVVGLFIHHFFTRQVFSTKIFLRFFFFFSE